MSPIVDRHVTSRGRRVVALGVAIGSAVCLASLDASRSLSAQPASSVHSSAIEVAETSVRDLQAALESGRVTSVQLVDAYLARIDAYDGRGPRLNSMIGVNPRARQRAAELDREREAGRTRSPLHGIPIVVKDNYDTADMPTTGGTLALASYTPPDDAFQVRRLREAGAIVIGKTNLHELAMGITTIGSLGGQTRNPYAPGRNPGGSSGGTGAAVAASFGAFGMGSDTCGSIRIPSSHNNLYGLRGTSGLSSRDGIIPLSHTQDIGGPLARTVTDLAIALDATVGPDDADATTTALPPLPSSFVAGLESRRIEAARIGRLETLFGEGGEDEAVATVVDAALDRLAELGAHVETVAIDDFEELMDDSSVIAHEFKWDLIDYLSAAPDPPIASLDEVLELGLFHEALEQRFRLRNEASSRDSEEYRQALAKRDVVRAAVEALLEAHDLDALAYPTIRRLPAPVGEPQFGSNCALAAHSGLPAISMPAGFTDDGIPVGLELIGARRSDVDLVALAYAWEQAVRPRRPPPTTPALVNGLAPAALVWTVVATPDAGVADATDGAGHATATVRVAYDVVRSELAYEVRAAGVPAEAVIAMHLQRGEPGVNGPTLHRLLPPGEVSAVGAITLSPRDIRDLEAGHLYVRLYTHDRPTGAARAQLTPPDR